MMRSFYNGISGVKTHSFGMDLLANNISNINTPGYRAAVPEFKDLLYQSAPQAGNFGSNQIGLAATGLSSAFSQRQGNLQITDRDFDVALEGRGFFGIRDIDGKDYFTRNGSFGIDAAETLVDDFGRYVLGTMNAGFKRENMPPVLADAMGVLRPGATVSPVHDVELAEPAQQGPIMLPRGLFSPAEPSKELNLRANLNPEVRWVHKNTPVANVSLAPANEGASGEAGGDGTDGGWVLSARPESAREGDLVIFEYDSAAGPQKRAATVGADGIARLELAERPGEGFEPRATQSARFKEPKLNAYETRIIDADGMKRTLRLEFTVRAGGKLVAHDGGEFDAAMAGPAAAARPGDADFASASGGPEYALRAVILSAGGEILAEQEGSVAMNYDGSLRSVDMGKIAGIALKFGTAVVKEQPAEGAGAAGGAGGAGAGAAGGAGGAAQPPRDPNAPSGFEGLVSLETVETIPTQIAADGDVAGILRGYSVDEFGNIQASFTNGKSAAVAKLAVFQFINEQGLEKRGENEFAATIDSNKPMFFRAPDGSVLNPARVMGQMLEMSNTDLGTELTTVIAFQKAYEASAKSISTADQMLKRAIEMKK